MSEHKDMVKNPSHYQGKYGLEVYDVLENFLEDVESYYVGNICLLYTSPSPRD